MQNETQEERFRVIKSWFAKWTNNQRQQFLKEFITNSLGRSEKIYVHNLTKTTCVETLDFTRHLPHSLTVLIMSYLDPRSLCCCAQVCWYWRYLSEMNDLWICKCLALGWCMPVDSPLQTSHTGWKQLFRRNFERLKLLSRPIIKDSCPMTDSATMTDVPVNSQLSSNSVQSVSKDVTLEEKQRPKSVISRKWSAPHTAITNQKCRPSSVNSIRTSSSGQKISCELIQLGKKHPPWRSSNRKPQDLIRYNYLDNDNVVWEMNQERVNVFGKYINRDES